LEIPEEALREAIFNSIIHKDYTGVTIQLKVYNDKITLWNEGKLPEGYTVETLLGDHSSKPRNRNIANVFYKAGFIESWGRGISKIFDGIKAAKLATPFLESTMGGVSLTIYRKEYVDDPINDPINGPINDPTKLVKQELEILILMLKNHSITYSEIGNELKISRSTVKRIIQKLRTNEYIIREGSNKIGNWIITDKGKKQIIKQ